jgi:hypothetical protein
MKKLFVYIGLAILTLAAFTWWYFQPVRVLERRLDKCLDTIAFDTSTSRSSRVIKANSLPGFFDAQVELHSSVDEANGNFSPDDISGAYTYLAENAREISLNRLGETSTRIDGDHATQEFEADLLIAINRWIDGPSGRHQITLHWRKADGEWKIHSAHASRMP